MALYKQIIFDNGVNIKYHRIEDINLDNKNKLVKITVVSYTNNTYRDKETLNKNNQDRYEELLKLIFAENEKLEMDRNVVQIIEWSNESNSLIGTFKEDINLTVIKTEFEFKNITNLNMDNLYELLKKESVFEGSEDC